MILLAAVPPGALLVMQSLSARSTVAVVAALLAVGASLALAVLLAGVAARQLARDAQVQAKAAQAASRARDEFLLMLSHELRNPLGAISAAVDVIDHPGTQGEIAAEALSIIARQTRGLSHVLNELLDVSCLIAGKTALARQPLDLAAVVGRVQQACAPVGAARGQRLTCRLQPAWSTGDAARLEQAFTRLVTDILRVAPPGGEVVLSVRREGELALVEVEAAGQAARAAGPGVGFMLAQRLAELHGGTLAVPTSPECGFILRLPAAEPVAIAHGDSLPPLFRRRVLVVQASDDALAVLRSQLELDGGTVSAAFGGRDGLSRLLQQHPEAAIVDVGLPALAGFELARQARAAGYAGCLIALSHREGDERDAMAAGFDACLVQPVDRARLLAALRNG